MKFLVRNWELAESDIFKVKEIATHCDGCDIAASVLVKRGIDLASIKATINPSLRANMPDPQTVTDMQKATEIVAQVVDNSGRVCILGDYDVDGMTSSAILQSYLTFLGVKTDVYLPSRFGEGYGGNASTSEAILSQYSPDVLIMVDNGSSSHELVAAFKEAGVKVVILDHHTIDTLMPEADAVVNPCRVDDSSGLEYLCSAGLVFLFLVAMNALWQKRGLENLAPTNLAQDDKDTPGAPKDQYVSSAMGAVIANKKPLKLPNLLKYLDLVALATVCDMVPLKGVNRAFVKKGLRLLAEDYAHCGLRAILELTNFGAALKPDTFGFVIGPFLNAASRMGKQELALQLLTTQDKVKADFLAKKLQEVNTARQLSENIIFNQAVELIERGSLHEQSVIFVGAQDWSSGLVGIIAGRIKEIYQKPTCVYSINPDGTATASGRSVVGVNLGSAVMNAKNEGLFIKGGGHAQAVGFSFDLANLEKITTFLQNQVTKQLTRSQVEAQTTGTIDAQISLLGVNKNLIESLSKLEPFGVAFAEPLFLIKAVKLEGAQLIGKNQNSISCFVTDGLQKVRSLCFKCLPSKLGYALQSTENKLYDLVVTVKGDLRKGNVYPMLHIVDVRPYETLS